ncbi:MAG: type II secretion system major pseudopilin GspG [Phycisphaerae bacterium]
MAATRIRRSARRRAFTLLEVLMVIVILGVLAALIIPQFGGTDTRARKDLTIALIKSGLASPLETFKMHCGRYPTSEEGLMVLLEKPSNEDIAAKWAGPYVKRDQLKDAFGSDLKYAAPGEYNQDSYDLSSPGPNKQFGDDDDITNWEKT